MASTGGIFLVIWPRPAPAYCATLAGGVPIAKLFAAAAHAAPAGASFSFVQTSDSRGTKDIGFNKAATRM